MWDLRDGNTFMDEYDEIGVKVVRDEQRLWFHSDEANVHVLIQKPPTTTLGFQHMHFPCISLHHSLGAVHQEQAVFFTFRDGHCSMVEKN